MGVELVFQPVGVQRVDVRIGNDGVSVARREVSDEKAGLGEETGLDPDPGGAQPDLFLARYQVTSPAPVRTFATRASMKRRSERRFR